MKLYFYCVIKDYKGDVKSDRGIGDQKVYLIHSKPLYAVVSTINRFSFPETASNNEIHENVVRQFMEKYPVLPFPFNTIVGERIGKGVLHKYYKDLLKNLGEIGKEFEFDLWISKKYKKNIQQNNTFGGMRRPDSPKELNTKILAAKINARFSHLAKQTSIIYLVNETIILDGKYLVGKEHISHFKNELIFTKKLYPELEFSLKGPIPPYSFNKVKIMENNVKYYK